LLKGARVLFQCACLCGRSCYIEMSHLTFHVAVWELGTRLRWLRLRPKTS
jgi:hypothetical protein